MKKPYINLLLIVLIFAAAVYIDMPHEINIFGLHREPSLSLGLDLQGGMQVLLEADVDENTTVTAEQLEVARQILENRSNGLGVSEVVFQVAGDKRIVAEFPGMTDTDEVLDTLKETGMLEFVDTGSTYFERGAKIKTDARPVAEDDTTVYTDDTVYHTILTGADLKNAAVQVYENSNIPVVAFQMSEAGGQIFSEFTRENVGKYLTLVLDGEVISSPRINSQIPGGEGVIEGNFDYESANALAIQLKYGSLPVPLKIVQYQKIGATLGEDSLQKSLVAGLIGLGLAALFMLLYYRVPGIAAVFAIIFYGAVTFAVYKMIPVTLSLSGIAGLLLTTGSAFDSNVLMFERLKEELRNGKTIKQAVNLVWPRAWSSIRDSNVATLITSAILFYFGSSFGATIVKGFAVTLALGVVISLLTTYLVTRTLLYFFTKNMKQEDHEKYLSA